MRADFLGHRVPDASRDLGQNISSESGQRSHHKLPFFRVHSEQTNQERLVQVITPGKSILIDRLLVNSQKECFFTGRIFPKLGTHSLPPGKCPQVK